MRETNHVSRVYNVGTILWLQYMVRVMLFLVINFLYLHINTPKYMLRAQCGCLPYFLDAVLSINVVQIFSELYADCSCCPYC